MMVVADDDDGSWTAMVVAGTMVAAGWGEHPSVGLGEALPLA
jgi:hypothetical protein